MAATGNWGCSTNLGAAAIENNLVEKFCEKYDLDQEEVIAGGRDLFPKKTKTLFIVFSLRFPLYLQR